MASLLRDSASKAFSTRCTLRRLPPIAHSCGCREAAAEPQARAAGLCGDAAGRRARSGCTGDSGPRAPSAGVRCRGVQESADRHRRCITPPEREDAHWRPRCAWAACQALPCVLIRMSASPFECDPGTSPPCSGSTCTQPQIVQALLPCLDAVPGWEHASRMLSTPTRV